LRSQTAGHSADGADLGLSKSRINVVYAARPIREPPQQLLESAHVRLRRTVLPFIGQHHHGKLLKSMATIPLRRW